MSSVRERYEEHIADLVEEHGLIRYLTWEKPYQLDGRELYVPPPVTMVHYLITLHEIGHYIVGNRPVLYGEGEAWEKALELSRFPLTEYARKYMVKCLNWYSLESYMALLMLKGDVDIPDIDHPFWRLANG